MTCEWQPFSMSSVCLYCPLHIELQWPASVDIRRYWLVIDISQSVATYVNRADSRLAPSQWEMSLQSNAISYWLGASLESALCKHGWSELWILMVSHDIESTILQVYKDEPHSYTLCAKVMGVKYGKWEYISPREHLRNHKHTFISIIFKSFVLTLPYFLLNFANKGHIKTE